MRHRLPGHGILRAVALVILLAQALPLGSCCPDCAELSQIGAATYAGPAAGSQGSSAPARARGTSENSRTSDPIDLPAGGEAVASGFYLNEQGQILTTWNEIRACRKLAILDEYEFRDASVVAVNSLSGLAVLQTGAPAPAYALFRTAAPMVGEDVSAFSYPVLDGMSLPLTEARGVVRSPTSPEGIGGILQSSALVDGQSPGGPIVDEHGEVIGMIISKLSSGWASNVAYAIGSAPILQFGSTAQVRMRMRDGPSSAVGASGRNIAHAAEYTVPVICFR